MTSGDRLYRAGAVAAAILIGLSIWIGLDSLNSRFVLTRDEAFVGYWARAVLMGSGDCPGTGNHLHFLGRPLPLQLYFYWGPWSCYTAVPFVRFFTDPVEALRLHTYAWAALGGISAYWLAYLVSGECLLAIFCALAMALSPQFVLGGVMRGTATGGMPAIFLGLAALACLARASQGSRAYWFLSCLLAGLCVGFVPHGVAVLMAWSVCVWWLRRELREGFRGAALALSILLLCVGISPLVLDNVIGSGHGLRLVFENLGTTQMGIKNADYWGNLGIRCRQLFTLLGMGGGWKEEAPPHGTLVAIAVLCAGLQIRRLFRCKDASAGPKSAFLPLIALFSFFLVSPLTLNNLRKPHLLLLLPLALAMVAATLRTCFPGSPRWRWAAHGVLLAWMLLGASGLRALTRQPPSKPPEESIAAFHPSERLLQRPPRRIFTFGWSAISGVRSLTPGPAPARPPELIASWCPARDTADFREFDPIIAQAEEGDYLAYDLRFCSPKIIEIHKALAMTLGKKLEDETSQVYPGGSAQLALYRLSLRVSRPALKHHG